VDEGTTQRPEEDGSAEPKRLGAWDVDGRIASSGFSAAFAVHRRSDGLRGVAKVFDERVLEDPDRLRRVRRHARVAGAMRHPNVERLLDLDLESVPAYMVFERVEGRTLGALLAASANGALTPTEATHIILGVLSALAVSHAAGVIHRDVKPDNIMVPTDPAGAIKLIDFGLAKGSEHEELTPSGFTVGTPAYMAPEQLLAERLDGRADLFSLGVVLYEMLSGRAPFRGTDSAATMISIVTKAPPPIVAPEGAKALPSPLVLLVKRLLAKEPGGRPSSATEVLQALGTDWADVYLAPAARWGAWSNVSGAPSHNFGPTLGWMVRHKHTGVEALLVRSRADPQMSARVSHTARAVAQIMHPHLAQVIDAGKDGEGFAWMVLRPTPTRTLHDLLARERALRVRPALAMARSIAAGLAALHRHGLVHRNVKPESIVLEEAGALLSELEFSSIPRAGITQTDVAVGTPAYMAPEQVLGERTRPRSDVYGLGCTLYEALTGDSPFKRASVDETMLQHLKATPAPPRGLLEPIPPSLSALILRMLAKDPEERPRSGEELIGLLEAVEKELDAEDSEDAPPRRIGTHTEMLEDAGLHGPRPAGRTEEGLLRFKARDDTGPVTVYVADPPAMHLEQRVRVEAVRWLHENEPPLFVRFEGEHRLPTSEIALPRRDPVPAPLALDVKLPDVGPAVAVAAVVHRALGLLRRHGRRFDDFDLRRVRADIDDPEAFACLLCEPRHYDPVETDVVTMQGGRFRSDPHYFSPAQHMGRPAWHDAAHTAGTVLYALLAGHPPLHDVLNLYELSQRRVQEDPPSLGLERPDLPAEVITLTDRLIARSESSRSRPPREVECDLLGLLGEDDPWREAAERVLVEVPEVEVPIDEAEPDEEKPPSGVLREGEQAGAWRLGRRLATGGEASVWEATGEAGEEGVLKVWFARRASPHGRTWARFKARMQACGEHAGFPRLLDSGELARRRPRPFVVLEHVKAPTWRERTESGTPPGQVDLLRTGARLLEAVCAAHELFGVAGDLSARNVLLRDDQPVILDVATPHKDRSELVGYGTPGYAAPEIAEGSPPSPATDIFAAGVLLVELALQERLFPKVVEGLLVPVGGYRERIDEALSRLDRSVAEAVAPMLAGDPKRRPGSAADAARRLSRAAERLTVRGAVTRHTGSSSLLGLQRRLPRPLALLLRRWHLERDPERRVRLAFGLGELVARWSAVVLLADYLSEEERDPKVEEILASLHRKATFGTWIGTAREVARAVEARSEPPFDPELAARFTVKGGTRALDDMVELRNPAVHEAITIAQGDLPELTKRTEALVDAMTGILRSLATRPMLVSEATDPSLGGCFDLSVVDLQGAAAEPVVRSLRVPAPLPSRMVSLCTPDLDRRLLLHPFVVYRGCERCGWPHVFVLAWSRRSGSVHYVDPAGGHAMDERPVGARGERESLVQVLDDRAELGLAGCLDAEPSEARRYWGYDLPVRGGTTLGRHLVDEEIGRGSMGVVFRATDVELDGARAIKVVHPDLATADGAAFRALRREAQLLERLGPNPGVVQVYELSSLPDESSFYLVMEMLDGGSLDDRLRREPKPALPEVWEMGDQLCAALEFLHANDVVHRDLKPSNVLLTRNGRLKVADFGVARDLRARQTSTVGFRGALMYAAPEQLSGGEVGPWSDRYALGLLLYDLLVGEVPASDAAHRARQVRVARKRLQDGAVHEPLRHHGEDRRLLSILDFIEALTRHDPERRPSSLAGLGPGPAADT